MAGVRVEPQALIAAAARLDAAAGALGAALSAHGGLLAPPPAGVDEVSVMVTDHFTGASASVNAATRSAITELTRAATALRAQAAGYSDVDLTVGSALSLGGPR